MVQVLLQINILPFLPSMNRQDIHFVITMSYLMDKFILHMDVFKE